MSTKIFALGTVCLVLGLIAAPNQGCATVEKTSSVNELSGDINNLSFGLYKELTGNAGGNAFFSPLSISTAFALAQQGAAGATAREMAEALRLRPDSSEIREAYAGLMESLNQRQSEGPFKLHIANALWVQQGYGIKDSFTKTAQGYFQAQAEEVDFQEKAKAAVERINEWVASKTADKIEKLIPEGAVDKFTRLILTNAVYFKGTWQSQFKEKATKAQDFHALDGTTFKVPTMRQTGAFKYAETEDLQALELPYKKCGLAMLVILPKKKAGLSHLETKLDHAALESLMGDLKHKRVRLALPRFKMETKYTLNKPMQSLGMKLAFAPGAADFSGITENEKLYIRTAIHKAYIDVDEEGTEAAAATGIVMRTTSAHIDPPTPFIADHPFMFMIRDTRTGVILFMGRILDPR